jgi:hypothetical protein
MITALAPSAINARTTSANAWSNSLGNFFISRFESPGVARVPRNWSP